MNRLLLALWLLGTGAALAAEKSGGVAEPDQPPPPPATVGTDKEAQPSAPAKGVEEPVFQLPDLVIVGENQARIMAQKEALAGSPLQGLHEAPLLEKEESSVAALRRREPAPVPYPTRTGTGLMVRLGGGTGGAFGGAGWIGRQTDRSLLGLEVNASRILGEPVGGGHAGGWEAGATVHAARDAAGDSRPDWLGAAAGGGVLEHAGASAGFGLSRLDLPRFGGLAGARRSRNSVEFSGETSGAGGKLETVADVRYASVEVPGSSGNALGFAIGGTATLTRWRTVTLLVRPRLEAESADGSGGPSLLGGSAEAAWVPSGRVRGVAGIALDAASARLPNGDSSMTGLAAPVAGLAWTLPAGTVVSARFAPRLAIPWVAVAAVGSPYSVFGGPTIAERTLGDLRVAVRQEHRDGSQVEVAYRLRESRMAPSWWEVPGTGLFAPAAVTHATVHEGRLSVNTLRWRPVSVRVEGAWRDIITTGGAIANLPESEGIISAEVPWRAFTFGASAAIARSRPGSIAGPLLPSYADLGLRAEWAPLPRFSVLAAGTNLGAARVERWAGYPEPRRLLTIGARATF